MTKMKNLLRHFRKIWKKKDNIDNLSNILIEKLLRNSKQINQEDYTGYSDSANILMVIPKVEGLKKLIEKNFEVKEGKERANSLINELDYNSEGIRESLYSPDYLNLIFNLMKDYDEIEIKMSGNDNPLWVECKEFIMILAPRVHN